jgi:uncharacterized RDD family membrane protein YckC
MVADGQVVTGEAVALELRTAGAGSRGVAAAIDLAVVSGLLIIPLVIVAVISSSVDGDTLGALLLVSYVGTVLGYPVLMETLWRGQTLGKAAMGLRVVRDDGGPIRFRHAFVRGLIGVVVDKPGITFGAGALFPILISSRHKRVGDMLAGTIVLSERVPGAVDISVAMPAPLAGWAAGLDLAAVDDGLAMRARQLLLRSGQLSPVALAALQKAVTDDLSTRIGAPPDGTPDWAVLAAVVAERRRRALGSARPPSLPQPSPDPAAITAPTPVSPPALSPPSSGGFAPPG